MPRLIIETPKQASNHRSAELGGATGIQAPSELTYFIYLDIFVYESPWSCASDTAGARGVLASPVIRAVTTTGEEAEAWRGPGTHTPAHAVTG